MQIIVPSLDSLGTYILEPNTWNCSTDPFPSTDQFPYIDGTTAPLGTIWLNDSAGFNNKTEVRYRFLLNIATTNTSGWKLRLNFRYNTNFPPDAGDFLEVRFFKGGSEGTFISRIIDALTAPGVFTMGEYNFTDVEIGTLNPSGVNYSLWLKSSVGSGFGTWDVTYAELTAPEAADIEFTGSGGVELDTGNLNVTGEGGVQVGQGLSSTPMVLSADVSGMYTLIPGRRFDRVYTRNTTPAQTSDVAIPTPYAKTGYFGA